MYVKKIALKNFRNYQVLDLELEPGISIFYGDNAQGKTNLLEAIYLCSLGKSHRTSNFRDFINFEEEFAIVKTIIHNNVNNSIQLNFSKNLKKGILVNNSQVKKMSELFGTLNVVMFSPEDLELIKQSPSHRRNFMDIFMCQTSDIYYYNLSQYYKTLKHRNMLLKKIKYKSDLANTISVWDEQLVNFGNEIIKFRSEFIEQINSFAKKVHYEITDGKEELEIVYKPNVIGDFLTKLQNNFEKDLIFGSTSMGTHKDDLVFNINNNDAHNFASQGQIRTIVLSIKISEILLITHLTSCMPVLLLDDVFSELDEHRQKSLLKFLENVQTFVTCTTKPEIFKEITCNYYRVTKGRVTYERI